MFLSKTDVYPIYHVPKTKYIILFFGSAEGKHY